MLGKEIRTKDRFLDSGDQELVLGRQTPEVEVQRLRPERADGGAVGCDERRGGRRLQLRWSCRKDRNISPTVDQELLA